MYIIAYTFQIVKIQPGGFSFPQEVAKRSGSTLVVSSSSGAGSSPNRSPNDPPIAWYPTPPGRFFAFFVRQNADFWHFKLCKVPIFEKSSADTPFLRLSNSIF